MLKSLFMATSSEEAKLLQQEIKRKTKEYSKYNNYSKEKKEEKVKIKIKK